MTPPSLPRVQRRDGAAAVVAALERFGGVIVEDLVTKPEVDALVAELRPHIDRADPEMKHINESLERFFQGVRNVTGLAGKSSTFVDAVLLNPTLLAAADAVIGPNCADYTLNVGHLMVREPGAPRQWLHRDQAVWSFLPVPHPEVEVASVIALADFTARNGATVVVPGSHRWDTDRRPQEHEVCVAEMPAGAGVVYLGSTIHGGGTNHSAHGRPGIHISYVAGWLRTEENNTLATPPAVARSLPRRAQDLLGYAVHDADSTGGGYLGCVDLHNPTDLLAAGQL